MELATSVQILDEAIFISLCCRKGKELCVPKYLPIVGSRGGESNAIGKS